jgi:cytochrome b6-f complex iron-sulfur subunit
MSAQTDRRTILNRLLYLWTGLTALPLISAVVRYIVPPQRNFSGTLTVGRVDEIERNSGRILELGGRPVILIRPDDGSVKAFRANCTHLGCIVSYRPDREDIYCGCHGSIFTLEGEPVSGPATRPLRALPITIENDTVRVSTG